MEASTKVYSIHFNHNATHKGFNQTLPGRFVGWWVGRWVGSMVGGWVILGLILVQLKLEIQLGQNVGNKYSMVKILLLSS